VRHQVIILSQDVHDAIDDQRVEPVTKAVIPTGIKPDLLQLGYV
jgi:hypothetical protein